MDKKDFFMLKKAMQDGAGISSFEWDDSYDKYPKHIWMVLSNKEQIKITINEEA